MYEHNDQIITHEPQFIINIDDDMGKLQEYVAALKISQDDWKERATVACAIISQFKAMLT